MKRIILPEEKLNEWAELLSERLFQSRYFENGMIKGEELKSCTEFPQINKFILFQLFQVVNHQIQRLQHSYFDMEHEEVQGASAQLKNQLSRHIAISQADFKPLLKKAIYNNLKLILDPVETLGNFFFHNQEKVALDTYEKYAPFFSDFDFAVNSILRYHQKNEMSVVEKDIFFVKLHRVVAIFNNAGEQDIETYRNNLMQRLTGKSMEELVIEAQLDTEQKRQEYARQQAEKQAAEEAEKRRIEDEARLESERIAAEAAALQKADEDAKAEVERQRLADEEAKRQAEEAKKSLFETLGARNDYFDIEDEGENIVKVEDEVIAVGADLPHIEMSVASPNITIPVVETPSFEMPSVDIPKVEVPTIETPSFEMPSVDIPKIEVPTIETPSFEMPSVDIPKIEVPTIETPSFEMPSVDIPKMEVPTIETPSFEMPSVDIPKVEVPTIETPSFEMPSVDIPKIEVPTIETPSFEMPSVDIPKVEVPTIETPSFEMPSVDIPKIEVPTIETPSFEMPSVDIPKMEVPTIETPSFEMPSVDIPKMEVPTIETPSFEMPKIETHEVELPDLRLSDANIDAPEIHETVVFQDEPVIIAPEVAKEEPVLSIFDKFFKKKPEASIEDKEETVILSAVEQQRLLAKEEAPKSLVESIIADAPQDLIHSIHAGKKIKLDEIPIHKQYMYVQRVFTGNNVRFRIIVDKANAANSKQEIEEIIEKYILSNPDIKPKDTVVEEFIAVLRGRFII